MHRSSLSAVKHVNYNLLFVSFFFSSTSQFPAPELFYLHEKRFRLYTFAFPAQRCALVSTFSVAFYG